MSAAEHDLFSEELAAYALGSLEPGEAAEMERHLETCDECRTQLVWLSPAIELLPESVPRLEPPPELRRRILAEVNEGAERSTAGARNRGRFRGFVMRPAVGLAVLALIIAGVAGYGLRSGGDGAQTFHDQSGAVTASLQRKGDSGTLELTGLSQLPSDEVYQAWVQKEGVMRPASVFAARSNGTASAAIPDKLNGAQSVAVTVEPRGGSQKPTSPPLVNVPLSS
jgi:anti-sigma-K factor RskA